MKKNMPIDYLFFSPINEKVEIKNESDFNREKAKYNKVLNTLHQKGYSVDKRNNKTIITNPRRPDERIELTFPESYREEKGGVKWFIQNRGKRIIWEGIGISVSVLVLLFYASSPISLALGSLIAMLRRAAVWGMEYTRWLTDKEKSYAFIDDVSDKLNNS
jgi:hypothetical protein